MTDVEKLLAIHDFLVRECDYDYANYLDGTIPMESSSAYGVLVNGTGVCQGYALAFLNLISRLGISCRLISSWGMNHAWNMVYIEGNWYHIDVTWDDPVFPYSGNNDYAKEGYVSHNYFVLSDNEITDHYGWSSDNPKASKDGSYPDYCFRKYNSAMSYSGGYWYYLPGGWESGILRSRVDGSNETRYLTDRYFSYMHGIGSQMYLVDDNGIYTTVAPDFANLQRVWTIAGSVGYHNFNIGEFTIKNNILAAVLYDVQAGSYDRIELLPSARETVLPKLQIVSFPSKKNYQLWNSLELDGLKLQVVYDNGKKLDISSGYTSNISYLNTTGLHEIELNWKGLTATFSITVNPSCPYTDILATDNNWIYVAAQYVSGKNIMVGTSSTIFAPDSILNRSMFAQIIYSLEGKPDISYSNIYPDVYAGEWYSNSVTWISQQGITSGYGNGNYGTNDSISREQLVLMLYKYADLKGYDISGRSNLVQYNDRDIISSWGVEAMQWAVNAGIITGKSNSILDPNGKATRAECATMMMSFCKKYS